jgi:hypothetical protein
MRSTAGSAFYRAVSRVASTEARWRATGEPDVDLLAFVSGDFTKTVAARRRDE